MKPKYSLEKLKKIATEVFGKKTDESLHDIERYWNIGYLGSQQIRGKYFVWYYDGHSEWVTDLKGNYPTKRELRYFDKKFN